jgi:hypothetical protein
LVLSIDEKSRIQALAPHPPRTARIGWVWHYQRWQR